MGLFAADPTDPDPLGRCGKPACGERVLLHALEWRLLFLSGVLSQKKGDIDGFRYWISASKQAIVPPTRFRQDPEA